jgi:hypothetical protein
MKHLRKIFERIYLYVFSANRMRKANDLVLKSKLLPNHQLFQLCHNGIIERDPSDPMTNIYLFSNFVFIRNDIVQRFPAVLLRLKSRTNKH